ETVQIERGLGLISEMESRLKQYKEHILKFRVMQFYFFFAKLYFLKGDYNDSLKWLNKILNENPDEVSPELLSYSRILRILIHYEKKDYDLIEHLIRSTKRFLSKNQAAFKFERSALEFLSKAISVSEERETEELLSLFRENLLEIQKDPYESIAIENLDLISWVDSKLRNRLIAEILKEKNIGK